MASCRRAVAAHLDRTRIAGELQLENWKRFGELPVNDHQRRHGRRRNRHSDNGAAGRRFSVYVPS